jgi:hypothetical protein
LTGDINNAGAARASGYMGANNAWQGALGGITNSLGSLGGNMKFSDLWRPKVYGMNDPGATG